MEFKAQKPKRSTEVKNKLSCCQSGEEWLRRVQRDDKFTAEGRVVFDAHLLENLAGHPYVTEVDPASTLGQGQRQAQRQGPLGLHRQPLSTDWRVYAEHRGSVLVGPVGGSSVPGLVHQECVLVAVQTVDDEVHGGVGKVCGGETTYVC